MYQSTNCACSEKPAGMAGMGFVEYIAAAGAVMDAFGNKKGGGGGGGSAEQPPSIMNTVSTSINTQISPQISPNFIQQSNPQDSPVNASASMIPQNLTPSVFPQYAAQPPQYAQPMQIPPVAIAGILGLLGLFFVVKMRKGSNAIPRRKSTTKPARRRNSRR